MSKMACRCGAVISDVVTPTPTEGWLYRDEDLDEYYDEMSRDITAFFTAVREERRGAWIGQFFSPEYPADLPDVEIVQDIITSHAGRRSLSVAECDACGRLWVQRSHGENRYLSYAPERPGYAAVLRSSKDEPA